MIEIDGLGSFEEQISALEDAMANTRDVTRVSAASWRRRTRRCRAQARACSNLSSGLARNLSRAFESVLFDGVKLSDALSSVGRSMVNSAFSAAVRPVSNQFGSLVSGGLQNLMAGAMPFAAGGAFRRGGSAPLPMAAWSASRRCFRCGVGLG